MRQMRLKKREIRDAEKLRQILADCDVVHIGAMDGDGMFVVPVNYGYEFCSASEGEETVSTAEGLKKRPQNMWPKLIIFFFLLIFLQPILFFRLLCSFLI